MPRLQSEPRLSALLGLGQDARLAARLLWRRPWASTVAVAVLAAGIAVTAVSFSLVHALVLQGGWLWFRC
jgi:hypothetical protein